MKQVILWVIVLVFGTGLVFVLLTGEEKTQITPQEASFELRRGPTSPERYGPPDEYNCEDFETWEESQEVFEAYGGVENDVHHLDHDNDGIPCEALR